MKKICCLVVVAVAAVVMTLSAAPVLTVQSEAPTIEGQYIETRSCDVFTAACFANSEVGLLGEEAIMAWGVTGGGFNGVELAGLKIVAIVKASATLGDTEANPLPAKSILLVDKNANPAQRDALIAFAKEMGGDLLADVVKVERETITMHICACSGGECGALTAGDQVAIKARCLHGADNTCGNDGYYYGPLTPTVSAMPHFTAHDKFTGKGLGVTWDDGGRRGTFLGSFAR